MPALELEEFWDDNNDAIKYSAGNWSRQYGGIYHGSVVVSLHEYPLLTML
jgi:hypothetical protein